MKKSILITITAALLLCAVLCTAGCVDAPADPIVGTYISETDSSVTYAVFEADGTAVFSAQNPDGTAETIDAVWKADGKGLYTITMNGEAVSCTLNAARGILDINGVLYQETLSPFSGAAASSRADSEMWYAPSLVDPGRGDAPSLVNPGMSEVFLAKNQEGDRVR